jgi:hypothetical protein
MGLTFEAMTDILKEYEVTYWLHPSRPAVIFSMGSPSGKRFVLTASVDGEGSFFQVRSVEYGHCPTTHKHFTAVATLLLALNYHYRAVKFSLDTEDGEITAFGDLVILDGEATAGQVMGLLSFFLNVLDESHERLLATLVNGVDPGEPRPEAVEPPEVGGEPGPAEEVV